MEHRLDNAVMVIHKGGKQSTSLQHTTILQLKAILFLLVIHVWLPHLLVVWRENLYLNIFPG